MKKETPILIDFPVTARKYKTQLTKKFIHRKFWVEPNPNDIHSFIPGTIIEISVNEGDIVNEGDPLLILEAMKMRNRIEMPFTAKIKKINVTVGSRIPKETLMIELESIEID
jgi:biotin carboxyl carrier protein